MAIISSTKKWHVGQKVYFIKDIDGRGQGTIGTVHSLRDDGTPREVRTDGTFGWDKIDSVGLYWAVGMNVERLAPLTTIGASACSCVDAIGESCNKITKKMMSFIEKLFLDQDTKTLKQAGFLNGNLELTSKGQDALHAILLNANKTAMVELAKDVIKEEEK